MGCAPSTGKSSNSSSSSNKAGACFTGLEAAAGSGSFAFVSCSLVVGAEGSEEDIIV